MYSRIAIFLLFVMFACVAIRVGAQQTTPATVPTPPSLSEFPQPPLPPPALPPPPQLTPPSTPPPSALPETPATSEGSADPELPPVAGVPVKEAFEILTRHQGELRNFPGVTSVGMGQDGIVVETTNPAALPKEVEGLPVLPTPPHSEAEKEGLVESGEEKVTPIPEQNCPSYAVWNPTVGRCQVVAPPPDQSSTPPAELLPPPPGVIILRRGGIREKADVCPKEFREEVSYGWRFCVDPGQPEEIPPLMAPPIVGIPYEEALEILKRHGDELRKLPGVEAVWLEADGIVVETNSPAKLPQQLEGLPIKATSPKQRSGLSHSRNTRIRPLQGAVMIGDAILQPTLLRGTLTGVALSKGRPWLVFPTHIMWHCKDPSPCVPGSTQFLDGCPHNHIIGPNMPLWAGTQLQQQPTAASTADPPESIGFVQRWDPLNPGTNTRDVAAAFMDNNQVEGDNSLSADRRVNVYGSFSGATAAPILNRPVTVVTSFDPHILTAKVSAVSTK